MIIVLDADMVLYDAVFMNERAFPLDHNEIALFNNTQDCFEEYRNQCNKIAERYESEFSDIIHCFTGTSKFRKDLYPEYKANRRDKRKPFGYNIVKKDIQSSIPNVHLHDEIEADDLVSIFSSMLTREQFGHVIFSGDKDLDQIPGLHGWFNKEDYRITPEEGRHLLWLQTITGDATDNIPGCPGIGKTRAPAYFNFKEADMADDMAYWAQTVYCYWKAKVQLPEEAALLNHRLVRLLTEGDYDFNTHQVKLWTPPISIA